jgi:hypothetical protein
VKDRIFFLTQQRRPFGVTPLSADVIFLPTCEHKRRQNSAPKMRATGRQEKPEKREENSCGLRSEISCCARESQPKCEEVSMKSDLGNTGFFALRVRFAFSSALWRIEIGGIPLQYVARSDILLLYLVDFSHFAFGKRVAYFTHSICRLTRQPWRCIRLDIHSQLALLEFSLSLSHLLRFLIFLCCRKGVV